MDLDPADLRQRLDHFRGTLRGAGVKITRQRVEVFREVVGAGDHPDAETVYRGVRRRVPAVSLDTVYRTLWLLLDLGLIATLGHPWERVRFDGNVEPHHHFVCTRCGRADDFHSEELSRLRIPDAVQALGRVEKTQVEIRGFCARCLREEGREAAGAGRRIRREMKP